MVRALLQHAAALRAAGLAAMLAIALGLGPAQAADGNGAGCVPLGHWMAPASHDGLDGEDLLDRMARRPAVLLGEVHTSAADHRWQLDTVTRLHARNRHMVLAFEAFPRRLQPVLDRWTAGTMSEQEFLAAVDWKKTWGYPARFYLPLFRFARRHHLKMLAMNVDSSLIKRVGRVGWDAIPPDQRHGISEPAPASAAYRAYLERAFARHADHGRGKTTDTASVARRRDRFIAAQLTWDRAMAEAIAWAHRVDHRSLVVGIVGRGHVEYGYGIPRQLRDLGIDDPATLLTWPQDRDCADLLDPHGVPIADAVFGVKRAAETGDASAPPASNEPPQPAKP